MYWFWYFSFLALVFLIVFGVMIALITINICDNKKEEREKRESREKEEREKRENRENLKTWLKRKNEAKIKNLIVENTGTIVEAYLQNKEFKRFLNLSETKYVIKDYYQIDDIDKTIRRVKVLVLLEDEEVVRAAYTKWLILNCEKEQKKFDEKVDKKVEIAAKEEK